MIRWFMSPYCVAKPNELKRRVYPTNMHTISFYAVWLSFWHHFVMDYCDLSAKLLQGSLTGSPSTDMVNLDISMDK